MDKKLIKRIISCQGSSYFVVALAALQYRESKQKNLNYKYENYLVMHNLAALPKQNIKIAEFIKKIAKIVGNWKSIVYIDAAKMNESKKRQGRPNLRKKFELIYDLIGTKTADEIYLLRNSKFENRLPMNAYLSAEKICYGDGFGLYNAADCMGDKFYKKALQNAINRNKGIRKLYAYSKTGLKILKDKLVELRKRLKAMTKHKIFLKKIDFDLGCYQLSEWLSGEPLMEIMITPPSFTLNILKKLEILLDNNYIVNLRERISNRSTIILLTSSFSETKVMSLENEILAYKEFLKTRDFPRESILLIKPHPRNNPKKIDRLEKELKDLYYNIAVLRDENLSFLPFEVLLMNLFLDDDLNPVYDFKVVTFNTSCIPLAVLFNISPIIGFGREIVSKFFRRRSDYKFRMRHESNMKRIIQKVLK